MHHRLPLFFCCLLWLLLPEMAAAVAVVRDDEIESVVAQIAAPVLHAAGPLGKSVRLHILADPQVNAYTSGGPDIFLHTGLILACDTPGMLRGVIAHELAHVTHGHVAKITNEHRLAQADSMTAMIIGAGAMLAGAGGAGMALGLGGMHVSERALLSHHRAHEQQADQTALESLGKARLSASEMLRFMQKLDQSSRMQYQFKNAYAITHPLTSTRMSQVRAHVEKEPATLRAEDPALIHAYARARLKLNAYLMSAHQAEQARPVLCAAGGETDRCYQDTILFWRVHDKSSALQNGSVLLAREPHNPYFHELMGQVHMTYGDTGPAIASYARAKQWAPKSALIRAELASVYLEEEEGAGHDHIRVALANLKEAYRLNAEDPHCLYLLAIAYGKLGDLGPSYYHLAELALLNGKTQEAVRHARHAKQYLTPGTGLYKKNEDLLALLPSG